MTQAVTNFSVGKVQIHRVASAQSQAVGSFQSDSIPVDFMDSYSVFANLTGTFTGDIYVEAATKQTESDSPTWFLITTSYTALTNATEVLFDAKVFSYTHIRVCVTVATGTATLNIDVAVKRK